MINTNYEKQLGKQSLFFLYIPGHSLSLIEVRTGTQNRNLETGTQAEESAYWLVSLHHVQSAIFLVHTGTTCPGLAPIHTVLVLPTLIINQENAQTKVPTGQSDTDIFL